MTITGRMTSLETKVVMEATKNMFLRSPTRVGNQRAVSEYLSRKIVVG